MFTVSNLLMMFNLTSGKSSFRRCKKRGRRCSIVTSLPSKGARPLIWLARAARTCCEVSWDRSRTQGTMRARMTSLSRSLEKPKDGQDGAFCEALRVLCSPGICDAAAERTSASLSFRSCTYCPINSSRTISTPTASDN